MRAMGTSSSTLVGVILFESLFLTVFGSAAGLLTATPVILYYEYFGLSLEAFAEGMALVGGAGSVIYPSLSISDIFIGVGIAMFMGVIASIYPAIKAIHLRPVKAIYNR